jgi:hypothetical protein
MNTNTRRSFLKQIGASVAALPFITGLPSVYGVSKAPCSAAKKKRLVIMFSPNGIVPDVFWPETTGTNFDLKTILQPLQPWKDRLLTLKGVANKIRGDGDGHMRGMSCLLTAIELFPGNIQGGSDTPAGWPSGISIDQEIKNFLQSNEETQTRFGSLEFGVAVPNRADTWTRMIYAGPNRPVAPIDDPYQMFKKMYGSLEDRENLLSVLDAVKEDLKKVSGAISSEDRLRLEEHAQWVREMETELEQAGKQKAWTGIPELEPGVPNGNDSIPQMSKMQIDLMVSGFVNDMNRVASLQYTNSVGNAKMRWLGIEEGHHSLSHDPDLNEESQAKLTKINTWFAEQLAYLVKKLDETPEPDGSGTLLDNTQIVWTNELGKGNSHTLNDIPFILVGNGLGFTMGRALDYRNDVPHNRLHLAMAHAFGHHLETFGKTKFCEYGPIDLINRDPQAETLETESGEKVAQAAG